jgi:hypothetical protein
VSSKAEKIYTDMKAVREAEQMARKRTYTTDTMPFEPAENDSPSFVQDEELKKEIEVSKEYMSGSADCGSERKLNGAGKAAKVTPHSMYSGVIPSPVDIPIEMKTVKTNQTDAKVRYTSCVFNQETR